MWDNILKLRIELQKSLVLINRLPQPENHKKFMKKNKPVYKKTVENCKYKTSIEH